MDADIALLIGLDVMCQTGLILDFHENYMQRGQKKWLSSGKYFRVQDFSTLDRVSFFKYKIRYKSNSSSLLSSFTKSSNHFIMSINSVVQELPQKFGSFLLR